MIKGIFNKVLGVFLLITVLLSVILLMIICTITYIPYLIFTFCAEVLHGASNLARLEEYMAEVREENK